MWMILPFDNVKALASSIFTLEKSKNTLDIYHATSSCLKVASSAFIKYIMTRVFNDTNYPCETIELF